MSLLLQIIEKNIVALQVYPQKPRKWGFFRENHAFPEKSYFRTWFQTSEFKNQGLKVPGWDPDQDFAFQHRDQDTKSRDQDLGLENYTTG